ncbi:MAG: 50S ribosomal protein L20 [Thermodesulfobacteriota bacterium]|jgi:large subunit ribosomal protein L20
MPRAKRGFKARRRRKKIMKLAKGYTGGRRRQYRQARETVERGLCYAYRDRRVRKRQFRRLWITRINAAARLNGINYNQFVHGLTRARVAIDRKMLAALAVHDPKAFAAVVDVAKQHVAAAA